MRGPFGRFVAGNLTSNCGTWAQNIALAVHVYDLTGSATWVGAAGAAPFVGVIALSPVSGRWADRVGRQRVLALSQRGGAAVALLLAVAAGLHAGPVVITLLALLGGLAIAVGHPAMHALVPALVPPARVAKAVAANAMSFTVARAVGPVVASIAIAIAGVEAVFVLNAATSLVFAAVVRRLVLPPSAVRATGAEGAAPWRPVGIAALLAFIAAVSVIIDPVATLLPSFADDVFGRGEGYVGLAASAFGAGAVLSGIVLVTAKVHLSPGLGLAGLIGGMVGFALAPTEVWSYLALAVAGAAQNYTIASVTTRVHELVPDRFRARVMGWWTVAFYGTRPVSGLADGMAAEAWTPRVAALAMVVPAAAVLALARPAGREEPEAAEGPLVDEHRPQADPPGRAGRATTG